MAIMAHKDVREKYVRAGFSLMEIMIAVMILGLVMAMVGPALNNAYKKSQKRTASASLKSFKNGISEYQRETRQYPAKLKDLIKKPAGIKDWDGPYVGGEGIEEVPEDPWGQLTPGAKHPYELHSWGPNGQGSPKDEWISVWEEPSKG
jgi:general secretion pathway protein G